MQKIYNPQKHTWTKLLQRPAQTIADIENTVLEVFDKVKTDGDKAIVDYTLKFDKVALSRIKISTEEIENAEKQIDNRLKKAVLLAKSNIEAFHKAQKTQKISLETTPGVFCQQEKRPIQKVGLYIPGGSTPLFSTVLMLAIPATIAGCKEVILCSPPNKSAKLDPLILFAASVCGVKKIFKVGGIQAIAAMTFGTTTIPRVYKIFGPGNQFVTVAKQLSTQFGVAIDMPAGPSELLVVADHTANAAFIASDLLSQAEHGSDSHVMLISTCKPLLRQVEKEVIKQCKTLPRRKIAEVVITNAKLIYVENNQTALQLIDQYAPEHLIVCVKDQDFYIDNISNAGSVFIGNYTPESAGDYASGTNHTLPTGGYAKQHSGVCLDSFMKSISFQRISKQGIINIGNTIELMAEAEGLEAHKNAVTLRLNSLKDH